MDDLVIPKEALATVSRIQATTTLKVDIPVVGEDKDVNIKADEKGRKIAPITAHDIPRAVTFGQYTGNTPESHPAIQHELLPSEEIDTLLDQIHTLKRDLKDLIPDLSELSDFDRAAATLLMNVPDRIEGENLESTTASIEIVTTLMRQLAIRNLETVKCEDLAAFITWECIDSLVEELEARTEEGGVTTDYPLRLEFEIDTTKWEDISTVSDNSIRGTWFERAVKMASFRLSTLLIDENAQREIGISANKWHAGLSFDNETGLLEFRVSGNELRLLTEAETFQH